MISFAYAEVWKKYVYSFIKIDFIVNISIKIMELLNECHNDVDYAINRVDMQVD